MKPSGLLSIFTLLEKKGSNRGLVIISSAKLSYSYPSQCKTPLQSNLALLKLLEKRSCAHTIHLKCIFAGYCCALQHCTKKWVQKVFHMSNETNWSLLLLLCFYIHFSFFFVFLFCLFGIVSFVTMTFDNFQFQSQVRLSQINLIGPIRLKFNFYAVFIEWGSWMDFLFVGQQNMVKYWDFRSKISRSCYKSLVLKITRHD